MNQQEENYRETMLRQMADIIELTGKENESYTNEQKALDILEVLEGLLGYTIFTVCNDAGEIRDACEESFVNIKRRALKLLPENMP